VSSVSVCGGGEDSGKGDEEVGKGDEEVSGGAVNVTVAEATALRCEVNSSSPAFSAVSLEVGIIRRGGRAVDIAHTLQGIKKICFIRVRTPAQIVQCINLRSEAYGVSICEVHMVYRFAK
jgi:hypothetical protein